MLLCVVSCGKTPETEPETEDKLVIYSPLPETMKDAMLTMFEQETGIEAECYPMGTGEALHQIQEEADQPQADILWSGTVGTVKNQAKYFTPCRSSHEESFYEDYQNRADGIVCFNAIPSVLMVNTELVGSVPVRGYADLLDPRLKGKIAFVDPARSSSSFEHLVNMLYAMGEGDPEKGWPFVEQLIQQLDGQLLTSSAEVYKGVADGKYAVGLIFEQASTQYEQWGAPISTVYMEEGVVLRGDGVYVIRNCPHPENAQIFIDWLTSRPVQEFMTSTQFRRSVRSDVAPAETMDAMEQLPILQADEDETAAHKEQWLKQFQMLVEQ